MRFALWSSLLLATAAWAGVSGHVSAQGQATTFESSDPLGSTQRAASLVLQEALGLHYAGIPFGPNVAFFTAGVEAANANSWGPGGVLVSGRTASIDLSVGLFPRRAVPLRLYARGTVAEGGGPSVLSMGARHSLLYGLSFNLDPGKVVPGVRLELQEQRFTAPLSPRPLTDATRSASVALYRAVGEHQLNLSAHLRDDSRQAIGSLTSAFVNGAWTSSRHHTGINFSQTDRSLAVPGFETGGLATDRQARVSYGHRWLPGLMTDANIRLVDSRFAAGSGTQAGAGVGASFKPLESHELLLSGMAEAGSTTTRSSQGTASGSSVGGGGRVGYSRPVKRVLAGGTLGANVSLCDCVGVGRGTRSNVEGGVSLSTIDLYKVDARLEYALSVVQAPPVLGGSRLEHHLRAQGQLRLSRATGLLTLGYDDGVRDFIDVSSGEVMPFAERVFLGVLGAQVPVSKGTVSAEIRHARGASFATASPFVAAPLPSARAITNLSVEVVYPLHRALDLRAGTQANWAALTGSQTLFTLGAQVFATTQVGRLSASLGYQFTRSDVSGVVASQHLIRLFLTRPFSL